MLFHYFVVVFFKTPSTLCRLSCYLQTGISCQIRTKLLFLKQHARRYWVFQRGSVGGFNCLMWNIFPSEKCVYISLSLQTLFWAWHPSDKKKVRTNRGVVCLQLRKMETKCSSESLVHFIRLHGLALHDLHIHCLKNISLISALDNEYWGFPRDKAAGARCLPPTSLQWRVANELELNIQLPFVPA
jgi:hypothetical protein